MASLYEIIISVLNVKEKFMKIRIGTSLVILNILYLFREVLGPCIVLAGTDHLNQLVMRKTLRWNKIVSVVNRKAEFP